MARDLDEDEEPIGHEELAVRLEGQQRARDLVSRAAVPAPSELRAQIEGMRAARPRGRARRAGAVAGGLAAALAVALALFLVLSPRVGDGPTVAEAAELGGLPSTRPAPAPRPREPSLLQAEAAGVPFPAWSAQFGWRAIGARVDEIDGRRADTLFYQSEGRRLAYTIVAGDALAPPEAPAITSNGTEVRVIERGDGLSVTWLRAGTTCVLSGAGVARERMIELATWRGEGTIPF